MKEMHNTNLVTPDGTALMLMAGSWSPILAVIWDMGTVAMGLSMAVSVLAAFDYAFKIHWKLTQGRKGKGRKQEQDAEEEQDADGR